MSGTLAQRLPSGRRAILTRRIRLFAAATITYNVIEAVVALWAGGVADSSALIGFGLDSVIEVASAVALSWQFSAKDPERREHLTLRIIAISFFALAAFVTMDAIRSLAGGGEAQHSTPGIVIAALSLAIMPVLSWAQRRAGRRARVPDRRRRLKADTALHLSFGGSSGGPGPEQHPGLVVGGRGSRHCDRRHRRPRGLQRLARGRVLRGAPRC